MILDGKRIKEEILNNLCNEVKELENKPNLTVIQVGNDEASNVYIKSKAKMSEYVGYEFNHIKLEEDTKMEYLLSLIDKLNDDKKVNGILIQMPLPEQIDSSIVLNRVLPEKDVDGLTDINTGMTCHNKETLLSCTPSGIMELLTSCNIPISGSHAVVVGRSNLVGKPIAMMLLNAGATVTVCHSKTKDLSKYTKDADILVVAVGKPRLITADMVKADSAIIDVGINRLDNGLCGDVCFDDIKTKASYITPVPGGVGPMTIAMLATNVLKAYRIQNK